MFFREMGRPNLWVLFLVVFEVFFGLPLVHLLRWPKWPFRLQPRIVPYFARRLGEFGGKTSAAFRRGRGVYTQIVALDRLAGARGVRPLSAFGFADDHYEQPVHWYPAAEGLRTVQALRQVCAEGALAARDVPEDLDALAAVLRAAADESVEFSLVLRLYKKDSLSS